MVISKGSGEVWCDDLGANPALWAGGLSASQSRSCAEGMWGSPHPNTQPVCRETLRNAPLPLDFG